jgi:hypothetical protein
MKRGVELGLTMSTPQDNPLDDSVDDSVIELTPIEPGDEPGRASVDPSALPTALPVYRSIKPPTPKPVTPATRGFVGPAMPMDDVEPDAPVASSADAPATVTPPQIMESPAEAIARPASPVAAVPLGASLGALDPSADSVSQSDAALPIAAASRVTPEAPATPPAAPRANPRETLPSKPKVALAAASSPRAKKGPPEFDELVAIFAQDEGEQEKYFPRWTKVVRVMGGGVDTRTRHARFAALAMLATSAKQMQTTAGGDMAQLASEIAALAAMLVESSAIWEFLVWHPRAIYEDESAVIQVDPTLYEIWSVMRRLCRSAMEQTGPEISPRSFDEAFAAVLKG